jgi:hypothetical protein
LLERIVSSRCGRLAYRFRKLVPLASFALGVGSYFLIQRQNILAQWLTVLMLVGWVVLIFEGLLCRAFARLLGERIPQLLLRYAAQSLHQETLFFALPFFLATTVWQSPQLLFTGLLIGAALVSAIDPIYYEVIGRRRWLFFAYHAYAMFAALLTAGPIIGAMSTGETIAMASFVTGLCALPSFHDVVRVRNWSRWLVLVGLAFALGGGAWLARFWIPPATLAAKHMVISTQLDAGNRQPGPERTRLTTTQLRAGGLYAFSAIKAPRGLHQKILHVWSHNGQVTDRITLNIQGSREAGYRTWSHITRFGAHPGGNWHVAVRTDDGQLIGIKHFIVIGNQDNGT